MNIEQIRNHCIAKKATTEEFPFDENTLVFKVLGKMFLMTPLNKWEQGEATITLKCDPEYTEELREQYESIYAGPYICNKHWNTIDLYKGEVSPSLIIELINHSYEMVVKGMTKKMRDTLSNL